MNVYKIKSDFENYWSFNIDSTELFQKMPTFSAKFKTKPRLEEWNKPDGHFYPSDNHKSNKVALPDVTTWLLGNLVLNEAAYEKIGKELSALGEFLPVNADGTSYFIFNVLNVIPDELIDRGNTKTTMQFGVPMGLESLGFIDSQIGDQLLFKTTADNLAGLYCTERFSTLLRNNDLRGLVLDKNLVSN
jgi:hypothetical protein